MNMLLLLKKNASLSPYSDKKVLSDAIKKNKYIVLAQTEGYDYIDELIEQLDLIEEILEGRRRGIVIIGDIEEDHQIMLKNAYSQFNFCFISGK